VSNVFFDYTAIGLMLNLYWHAVWFNNVFVVFGLTTVRESTCEIMTSFPVTAMLMVMATQCLLVSSQST